MSDSFWVKHLTQVELAIADELEVRRVCAVQAALNERDHLFDNLQKKDNEINN